MNQQTTSAHISPQTNPEVHISYESTPTQFVQAQATKLQERLWAPDFARGLALLGIMVANMYYYLGSHYEGMIGKKLDPAGADLSNSDSWVDLFSLLFFDNRGFPLFSLLFGYGLAMIYTKSQQRGESSGHFLLQMLKRHGLLLAIGLIHGVFFYAGDIIATYAILGMILSLILVAPRWVLWLMLICTALLAPLFGVLDVLALLSSEVTGTEGAFAATNSSDVSQSSWLMALLWRAISMLLMLLILAVVAPLIFFPMLLGAWLQKLDFFGKAAQFPARFAAIAIVGILISLLGALPAIWYYLQPTELNFLEAVGIGYTHQLSGYFGAVGYAAVAALITARKPKILLPLVALGTMSMSGYLFQSLAAVIVYPNYALGYAAKWGSTEAFGFSLAVWAFTVLVAWLLYRLKKRGPVEFVFRRLLYKKAASSN